MIGTTNGVMGYLSEQQPELINIGCPCHLVNLAAEKGAKTLSVLKIWYYLEKSKKQKRKFQEFQMLCDGETSKILKHGCTRWLSLGLCLQRLIDNWTALLHFFDEEASKAKAQNTAPRL